MASFPSFACGLYRVELRLLAVEVVAIQFVAEPYDPAPGMMTDLENQRHDQVCHGFG